MAKYFSVEPLIPDKLIKANELKEVSNPVFFNYNDSPTTDGLLSNEIFGITKNDRAGTFAFINLHETFMHPFHYKLWASIDSNVKKVVHGISTFKIDSNGAFVEDPDGDSGIDFIKKNLDKIKFRRTDSEKRDKIIEFLTKHKDSMFLTKSIVIPAFFRDVNTTEGKVAVGDINRLYNSLLIAVRSLKESADYGYSISNSVRGRIQEILVQIYQWFVDGGSSNPALGGGTGIIGKKGILHGANMSKTTTYGSRLVITAPKVNYEDIDDMLVDMEYSGLPLSSALANFYPFIIHWLRNFFNNEFTTSKDYPILSNKTGKVSYLPVKDFQIHFSDEAVQKQINRFIHGFSNRFIPVEVPVIRDGKVITGYMRFSGKKYNDKEQIEDSDNGNPSELVNRPLTWCDLFYMAAESVIKDKMVLITRFPIDSYYNQFPTKVRILSTTDTVPLVINNTVYTHYPKISPDDILTDTSDLFIDTFQMCNAYLTSIGGDYDGDQVTVKGMHTVEANKELEEQLYSKKHVIGLNGINAMVSHHEGVHVLYLLTHSKDTDKLEAPVF